MKNTIIQWNCRGLRANYDELQLLFNDYDPAVVCLQETYLTEPNHVTFRNYNLFNTFAVGDGRLVVLRLNVPVNNFSVISGRSHRFLGN